MSTASAPAPARASALGPSGLRVVAETTYPTSAAGTRVRMMNFAPFLRPFGVDLRCQPTLTEREYATISSSAGALCKVGVIARAAARLSLRSAPDDMLTVVHRLRFLVPHPADARRRVDVYDLDDALFVGSSLPINQRFAWLKREGPRSVGYMKRARLVIAGNLFLADAASRHAHRVELVPSCVDPTTQEVRQHEDTDVVTVGWVGSPSTSIYLVDVLPVFDRLNADSTRFRLVLLGADPSLRAPWIEHRTWSVAAERQALAEFDLGIMPLSDDLWARGKCGYKLLLYFAAGVPAIASPVGVNRDMVGPDRGLLAESPAEWAEALNSLAADVGMRREMGTAARAFLEREFSYQRWAPELARMLLSVSGS